MPTRRWGDQWQAPCTTFQPGGEKRKPERALLGWMGYEEYAAIPAVPVCHACGHPKEDHPFERVETYHPALPGVVREEIRHV